MEEQRLRSALVKHGYSLFIRGLSYGATGNMSVRLADGSLLVTPTGYSLGRLNAKDLSILNMNGELVSGPPPTKEAHMHLACYAANPECHTVVHLHSPYATAFSCLDGLDPEDCMPPITPYFLMRIGGLPLAPYCKPGSPQIGEYITRLMPGRKAVLLANHGPVVCGKSLEDAVDNAEELESSARMYFILHSHKMRTLTPTEREDMTPSRKR
ncbi:MAG: aldolase [Desulfovibrionaceae bacterium]|nr:aldolase [Desulfovibrionaceae bacterium]